MPFLDHQVVAQAMTIPLGLKTCRPVRGRVAQRDRSTARGPAHRFGEWSTRVRPVWVRQHSYALRRRLGPMGDEHGGLLSPDYMHRVIDLEFPAMRRFFRMDAITDSGLWRRIANLEYLAAELGSKLV
ncbi:hypothetical protein DdX_20971 [Ditylenchus destructor]|uniref:Uncharacterized protein n=1 Tax=Ditylenchus destructor TaxID=166010 RepID=A0AAD4MGF5_9BILA|nr:hypothetical protein DdX_20971 [Ditylenchus destructor]